MGMRTEKEMLMRGIEGREELREIEDVRGFLYSNYGCT